MSGRHVFFIHGAGHPRHPDGSGMLADYLTRELGDDFRVVAPTMPEPDDPHYRPWRDEIERQMSELGDDLLLVGHSFGASVLLKYLAEGTYQRPIAAIFLVSVPFWGSDFASFALPDDFATRLPDAPIFLYHSRDDPEVPFSHLRRYQEHLPHATARLIDGSQHSFTDGLPQLALDIQAFSATNSNTG
jgi:uncharacterized protein